MSVFSDEDLAKLKALLKSPTDFEHEVVPQKDLRGIVARLEAAEAATKYRLAFKNKSDSNTEELLLNKWLKASGKGGENV